MIFKLETFFFLSSKYQNLDGNYYFGSVSDQYHQWPLDGLCESCSCCFKSLGRVFGVLAWICDSGESISYQSAAVKAKTGQNDSRRGYSLAIRKVEE